MNFLTLFLIVMSVIIVALLVFLIYKLRANKGKGPISEEFLTSISDFGALKTLLASVETNQKLHSQLIYELKGLVSSDSKTQGRLQEHMEQALKGIDNLRQSNEAFQQRERENRESLRRMETVIAGTKLKGMAGENILKEVLSSFPPKMVQPNIKIKGKEVEFGLILANNKIMPIDSKWPSTELLDEFSKEEDHVQKERLSNQIQKEVIRRVTEIRQYIDPETTTPWAIAAIPDSAYMICKSAHFDAYKQNVILISYSMIAPYLLMFFSLHLQYSGTVDLDNLTHYILDIKRQIEKMSEILENKIYRASTMIINASDEYRQLLGSVKGSLSALQTQGALKENNVK
ncbi:MAG: DNA recombination protein RmuC [Candidatus Omnitrophota bacterium]